MNPGTGIPLTAVFRRNEQGSGFTGIVAELPGPYARGDTLAETLDADTTPVIAINELLRIPLPIRIRLGDDNRFVRQMIDSSVIVGVTLEPRNWLSSYRLSPILKIRMHDAASVRRCAATPAKGPGAVTARPSLVGYDSSIGGGCGAGAGVACFARFTPNLFSRFIVSTCGRRLACCFWRTSRWVMA